MKKSFTLVELLAVMAIISVLFSLIVPNLSFMKEKARYAAWKQFSFTKRADPELVVYYNFEDIPDESSPTLQNIAGGSKYEAKQYHGVIEGTNRAELDESEVGFHFDILPEELRWGRKPAMYFNGSVRINLGNNIGVNIDPGKEEFTCEIWFKFLSKSSSSPLFTKRDNNDRQYALKISGSKKKFKWYVGNANDNSQRGLSDSADAMSAGEWYYATLVNREVSSGVFKSSLYLNGELQSKECTSSTVFSGNNLVIGDSEVGGGNWFNGYIDEFAIYRRALTRGEINNAYQTGKP